MICASILLSSFVLHLDAVNDLLSLLKKNDSWDKLRKILDRENEHDMPKPFLSWRTEDGIIQISVIEDACVSGSELFKIWGKVSELLHCRNPLQIQSSTQEKAKELSTYLDRPTVIMAPHTIAIPADGMLYMINVNITSGASEEHWWVAGRLDNARRFWSKHVVLEKKHSLFFKNKFFIITRP